MSKAAKDAASEAARTAEQAAGAARAAADEARRMAEAIRALSRVAVEGAPGLEWRLAAEDEHIGAIGAAQELEPAFLKEAANLAHRGPRT